MENCYVSGRVDWILQRGHFLQVTLPITLILFKILMVGFLATCKYIE